MFRDGSNDGDVNLCIASVPQGVESTTPWSNVAGIGEHDNSHKDETGNGSNGRQEEGLQLRLGKEGLHVLQKSISLQEKENTRRGHVFTGANWLKADERNLHRKQKTENEERRVA